MTKQLNTSGDTDTPTTGSASRQKPTGADQDTARVLETRPLPAADVETTAGPAADDEGDPTVFAPNIQQQPRPQQDGQGQARKHTLSSAITRPVQPTEQETIAAAQDIPPSSPSHTATPSQTSQPSIPIEGENEDEEWATADQATVYLPPRRALRASIQNTPPAAPPTLDAATRPAAAQSPIDHPPTSMPESLRPEAPSRPRTLGQVVRPPAQTPYGGQRFASPTGRPMPPTPPEGVSRAALPDPRMQRFQELRQRRLAYQAGEIPADTAKPVAETVRQWWKELAPGLQNGLSYQREARASGVHPIPPHVATTVSRLGDAFGRLAASARELTGRAQAAVAPALKRIQDQAERLHDQAEQHAGTLVEKIEGAAPVRQQGPLLGPGRIAVFFRQGVSVSQAQGLLAANRARPIRLIPRKHGFLTLVQPGAEAAVAERLRQHPYIRDVEYLQFDEFGHALEDTY